MIARSLAKAALVGVALAAAAPALAHHPMGGATPETFGQGLLSGLGHPVIGIDHLAALIGVGLVSARFARGALLPLAWVVAMVAGVGLHARGIDLPLAEALVALAVVAIGAAAALRPTLPAPLSTGLFALGGLAHGHALAETIIGAETGPVVAYLLGLVLVQGALTLGVRSAALRLASGEVAASPRLRLAGLGVAAVGLGALVLPALA